MNEFFNAALSTPEVDGVEIYSAHDASRSADSTQVSRRAVLGFVAASAGGLALAGVAGTGATAAPVSASARDRLVMGTYRPSLATAGVIAGSRLTVTHNHVPRTGATYTNLDVRCSVVPGANVGNVTYRNCIFRGPMTLPQSYSSLYTMFRPHKGGFTFIDCTFRPQHPNFRWVGIQGYGFTMRRCDASKLVDQVEVFNSNNGPKGAGDNSLRNGPCRVVIEQCYFHDSAYWGPGVDTSKDGSHSDGIQWQGGTGLVVRGNYFTGKLKSQYGRNYLGGTTTNSAMMIKPDAGNISGAVITKNWFGGGAVTINVADAPKKNRYISNLGSLTHNHFYRDQFYAPTAILVGTTKSGSHTQIGVTAASNVWVANGKAVPVIRKSF
jgi:hypothetical protein